ncbi:MAG: hypothetical protein ACUVRV_06675 [Cyanobacteriota bacterium]
MTGAGDHQNHTGGGGLPGFFSGTANLDGPPAILYANCCCGEQKRFKSSRQGLSLSSVGAIMLSYTLGGNFTPHAIGFAGLW